MKRRIMNFPIRKYLEQNNGASNMLLFKKIYLYILDHYLSEQKNIILDFRRGLLFYVKIVYCENI